MPKGIRANIIGKKFDRVTVLREVTSQTKERKYECQCDCGTIFKALGQNLASGTTKSCGCFARETKTKHGFKTRDKNREHKAEYEVWCKIKQRCTNPNSKDYSYYGERGISIYPEWDDFTVFLSQVGFRPSSEHSLDRIDNDGNYEPGNVRWATKKEQMNNTRGNLLVLFNGKEQTLSQWADELGLSYNPLWKRIKRGWSVTKALTTPIGANE